MQLFASVLTAIYPVLIYFGLSRFEPRILALLLVIVALLRWRKGRTMISGLGWEGSIALVAPIVLAIATGINNNEISLKLYPVTVNLALLLAFGVTLIKKPSMVERIARLRDSALSAEGVQYTRSVTKIWCAFFALNGIISAWTAFDTSRETWTLYNGFVVYIIIGTIFGVEWLYRRSHFQSKRGL
jgi:uncharacterized membrane protein